MNAKLWWTGFTTFILRAYQDIVRYFILTIAPAAVTTALYFAVFGELIGPRLGNIGGVAYKHFIAPGLITMPIITNSYSQAALSFLTAKFHRTIDEHLVSPQPTWSIVVCYAAGGMMRGTLVGLVVAIVALCFAPLHIRHVLVLVAGVLLVALVSSLAGFISAVFARTFEQINWVLSFVLTPLTYLGGVFYSIALLPPWAQKLSLVNPVFYAVDFFRFAMLGVSYVDGKIAAAIMLLVSLTLIGIATQLMRRGVGIRE